MLMVTTTDENLSQTMLQIKIIQLKRYETVGKEATVRFRSQNLELKVFELFQMN